MAIYSLGVGFLQKSTPELIGILRLHVHQLSIPAVAHSSVLLVGEQARVNFLSATVPSAKTVDSPLLHSLATLSCNEVSVQDTYIYNRH